MASVGLPVSSVAAPSLLRRALESPWLRPLNDPAAIDDLVGLVRPTFSLTKIRARVLEVRRETPAATTLVLAPNRRWPGHRAGQHVLAETSLRGRLLRRTFSISSAPRSDGTIDITVKRRDGGIVSAWWNEHARVDDVMTLSAPAGSFVLPERTPERLVLVSAGSGITPVMSMLRALADGDAPSQVDFIHVARSRADMIFAEELERLAARHAWLRVALRFTSESGRFDDDAWTSLAAGLADAPAYVCGPSGFMQSARRAWRAAGRESSLHTESFGFEPGMDTGASGGEVLASRSGTRFAVAPGQSLLAAAEAAGLTPKHGCRMGICHTCVCRKLGGTTVDLRSGHVSAEPDEIIQLCVTSAAADEHITLDL